MTASDGGKGSGRRPGTGYQDAWERIFGGQKDACTEVHRTSSEQSAAQSSASVRATPSRGAPHSLCIECELSAVQICSAPDCQEKRI